MLSSFVVHTSTIYYVTESSQYLLTFIKQAINPMIVRWHLALQELDFQILFVPGVDNFIADAMSRLCINNKPEVPTAILAANNGPYVINNDNYKIIESVHNAM
jgi:hypothetical protein